MENNHVTVMDRLIGRVKMENICYIFKLSHNSYKNHIGSVLICKVDFTDMQCFLGRGNNLDRDTLPNHRTLQLLISVM